MACWVQHAQTGEVVDTIEASLARVLGFQHPREARAVGRMRARALGRQAARHIVNAASRGMSRRRRSR